MRGVCAPRIAAACAAAVVLLLPASRADAQVAATPASPVRSIAGLSELSRSLEQLVEKISPSVVQIFVTGYVPPDGDDPATSGEPAVERSRGSGVILDPDGYILTNAHASSTRPGWKWSCRSRPRGTWSGSTR